MIETEKHLNRSLWISVGQKVPAAFGDALACPGFIVVVLPTAMASSNGRCPEVNCYPAPSDCRCFFCSSCHCELRSRRGGASSLLNTHRAVLLLASNGKVATQSTALAWAICWLSSTSSRGLDTHEHVIDDWVWGFREGLLLIRE